MVKIDRGTWFQIFLITPLFAICGFLIAYFISAFILGALADVYSKGLYSCNITGAGFDLNLIKFFITPNVVNKYNTFNNQFNTSLCVSNKTLNSFCDISSSSYISYYNENVATYLDYTNFTTCNNYVNDIFCNYLTFSCDSYNHVEYLGGVIVNCTILNYPNYSNFDKCKNILNAPCKNNLNNTVLYPYILKFESLCLEINK